MMKPSLRGESSQLSEKGEQRCKLCFHVAHLEYTPRNEMKMARGSGGNHALFRLDAEKSKME